MNERLELDSILFFKIHYSYSCSMSFKYIRSDLYSVWSSLIKFCAILLYIDADLPLILELVGK